MAGLVDRSFGLLQRLLPTHPLSRLLHWLARLRAPLLCRPFIRLFVATFSVDLSEAAQPDVRRYGTINEFFTRALATGARPLAGDDDTVVCPVDGRVSQAGRIDGQRLLQAKDRTFEVADLLGGDAKVAAQFASGSFATLYLAPYDYHRIHMPLTGTLREMRLVPGRLFSVNAATTRAIPDLFARNERVIALFETTAGPMAVVMVGAFFVGSIETVWAGEVTPRERRRTHHWVYPDEKPTVLERGAELGRFNMGSTVIVLFGPDRVELAATVVPDAVTRVGQALARVTGRSRHA